MISWVDINFPTSGQYMVLLFWYTFLYLILLPSTSYAETTSNSTIDFSRISNLYNHPECVIKCLDPKTVGCTNDECLCGNKQNKDEALERLAMCTNRECEDKQNESNDARYLLLDYCREKGFVGDHPRLHLHITLYNLPPYLLADQLNMYMRTLIN